MKVIVEFYIVLLSPWVIFSLGNDLVHEKSGNVSILGIFGSNCDYEGGKELQEMTSAIWTIEALNNYRYLPGITIGLSLYKTCVGKTEAQNTVLGDLIDKNLSSNNESVNIGILTTAEVYETLEPFKPTQNKRLKRVNHIIDADMFVDLTVQLLNNLQWTVVDGVVSDSENILNSFGEKSSDEGICVRDELLINNSDFSFKVNPLSEDSPVIVVIAAFPAILKLFRESLNQTDKLILVPTDFTFEFPLHGLKNAIVLLPSMERTDVLSRYIKKTEQQKYFFGHRGPTKSPLFMGVASSIIKSLDPLKRLQDEHCRDINLNSKQPCAEVVDFIGDLKENKSVSLAGRSMKVLPDDIVNALHVLKIDPNSNDEMFLYIASLVNSNASEDVAIFQIFSLKTKNLQPILLMINDDLLRNREVINKSETNAEHIEQTFGAGLEGVFQEKTNFRSFIKLAKGLVGTKGNLKKPPEQLRFPPDNATMETESPYFPNGVRQGCQNFVKNHTKASRKNDTMGNRPVVVWRFLTWVAINTSVGFMGVMCTISIMFFIASRICKGDVFEGSPYFTLLLMLAVVFVFISSLPFHFDVFFNPPVICSFRINGPPLAYAVLFSLLLSRSLMLASSEGGGAFVSHINGYIQSVLCFFMFGVQVSLGLQLWIYKDAHPPHCTRMHDGYKFVISLGYDFFLLALLACVSPFIIRSKRNYKEGLFFSLSIFFIIVVWSVWISLYFLLPEQKDATVAVGLNATATVLLLCVFIPRTYLMAAVIVRDRTARSLPPLDQNILSDLCDANYKSNQTLNDSVFGTITYRSCEMGTSNPNFYSGKSSGSSRENTNESLNRESMLDVIVNTSQGLKRDSRKITICIVYLSLFLDNVLLTMVVPIMPDFLMNSGPGQPPEESNNQEYRALISKSGNKSKEDYKSDLGVSFDLNIENGKVGFLLSSKAIVQIVLNPLVGIVTTRMGYRLPLFLGTSVLFVSAIVFAFGGGYFTLLLARSLQGVASSCIGITGMCLVAEKYPNEPDRSKMMGIVLGSVAVGVLMGYPFGGFMYDCMGKSAPFLIIATLVCFNGALQLYSSDLKPAEEKYFRKVGWRKLLTDKKILLTGGAIGMSTSTIAILEPCLPIWLLKEIKPKKWQIGTAFIPDSLGYVIGTNSMGIIAYQIGRSKIALPAMILVGLSAFLVPSAKTMLQLVVPHFLLGFGIGAVDAALVPLLAALVDTKYSAHYGTVYAMQQMAVGLAYSLGPVFGSEVARVIGFPWMMRCIGLINILYSPCLLVLGRFVEEDASEGKVDFHKGSGVYQEFTNSEDSE